MRRKPTLFIGSSKEGRTIAEKLQKGLEGSFQTKPWWEVFEGGDITIERLLQVSQEADAAVLVFRKDDDLSSRGMSHAVTRDNVLLEFGMFLGALGRRRVWILKERGTYVPSDLAGVSYHEFLRRGYGPGVEKCVREIKSRRRELLEHDARSFGWLDLVVPVSQNGGGRPSAVPPEIASFIDGQLRTFKTLAASANAEENRSIAPDVAISFIRSATQTANLILSVDLELSTWSYILGDDERESARQRFAARALPRDPTALEGRRRLDDFENLFSKTLERISQRKPNLVEPAPGIVRTFVVDRSTLTWEEWAILEKLSRIQDSHRNGGGERFMHNKVVFLPERGEAERNWVRGQEDTILFLNARSPRNRRVTEHKPTLSEQRFSAVAIREAIGGLAAARIRSTALGADARPGAYEYAVGMWNRAEEIEPAELADRVEAH